jgi:hypothetical protein
MPKTAEMAFIFSVLLNNCAVLAYLKCDFGELCTSTFKLVPVKKLLFCLVLGAVLAVLARPTMAQYVAADTNTKNPYADKPTKKQKNEDKSGFWQKVNVGGNFGASFGNVTYLEASPLLSYRVTDKLQVGPGLTYIYYRYNYPGYNFSASQYGGRFFGRYFVIDDLFAHAELEALNIGVKNADYSGRKTLIYPLVGGGYRQRFGANGGVYVTVL